MYCGAAMIRAEVALWPFPNGSGTASVVAVSPSTAPTQIFEQKK